MASPTSAHEDSENLSLDGNEVVDIFSDIRELDVVDELVNVEAKWKDMVNFTNASYENKVSCVVNISEMKRRILVGNIDVTYQVQINIGDSGFVCWRKFDEFEIFRKYLVSRFVGAVIAPLPKRFSSFATVTEHMVEKRASKLELFLESVARHTFLRKDIVFIHFIHSMDPIDKQSMETLLRDNISEGLHRWKEMIRLCKTPARPYALLKTVQKEVAQMLQFYQTLVTAVRVYMSRVSTFAASTNQFGEVLQTWKNLEGTQSAIQATVIDEQNIENAPLTSMIRHMEEAYLAVSQMQAKQSPKLKEILKGPIKFEISVLNNMKTSLGKVKAVLSKYAKACKTLKVVEANAIKQSSMDVPVRTASPPSSPRGNEVLNGFDLGSLNAVKTARLAKRDAQKEARQIICSTLVIEVQRFRFQRGKRGNRILRNLAELNMAFGMETNKTWQSVADSIPHFDRLTANADSKLLKSFEQRPGGISDDDVNDDMDKIENVAASGNAGLSPCKSRSETLDISDEDDDEYNFDEDKARLHTEDSEAIENRTSIPVQEGESSLVDSGISQKESNQIKEEKYDDDFGGMKYFRAIHSFQGENDNELCVTEGDELTLDPEDAETADENSEWLWLIKDNGEEGYVPGSHVKLVIH